MLKRIHTIAPSKHFAFRGRGLSFLGKQRTLSCGIFGSRYSHRSLRILTTLVICVYTNVRFLHHCFTSYIYDCLDFLTAFMILATRPPQITTIPMIIINIALAVISFYLPVCFFKSFGIPTLQSHQETNY